MEKITNYITWLLSYEKSHEDHNTGTQNLRFFYTPMSKRKVWALLEVYPTEKVYEMMNHAFPIEALNQWKKIINAGDYAHQYAKFNKKQYITAEVESNIIEWYTKQLAEGNIRI